MQPKFLRASHGARLEPREISGDLSQDLQMQVLTLHYGPSPCGPGSGHSESTQRGLGKGRWTLRHGAGCLLVAFQDSKTPRRVASADKSDGQAFERPELPVSLGIGGTIELTDMGFISGFGVRPIHEGFPIWCPTHFGFTNIKDMVYHSMVSHPLHSASNLWRAASPLACF